MKVCRKFIILLIALCLLLPDSVFAKGRSLSVIRDDEIESLLREILNPIFVTAGLNAENVSIYLIQDDSLNAFVAGGQNVFIHTGLIKTYKNPDVLMGVMAHEVSHISLGHLAKGYEDMRRAQLKANLSVFLGVLAMAAGSPEAGQAAMAGGMDIAQKDYLKYSRIKEESADKEALAYLDRLNLNASGLIELMEDLNNQKNLITDSVDEYSTTHPITTKRLSYLKESVEESNKSNDWFNKKYQYRYGMIRAKIKSFTQDLSLTLMEYSGQSDEDLYARSIGYMKDFNYVQAEKNIKDLIKKRPGNPYFYELEAELFVKNGDFGKAIKAYEKALNLKPNSPVIIFSWAGLVLSKSGDELTLENQEKLINGLKFALYREPNYIRGWYLLAKVYSNSGDEVFSSLYLAEYYLRRGDSRRAIKYANKVKEKAADDTVILRADDIILQARGGLQR